jgi:predicted NUDIX family phosphoesterase
MSKDNELILTTTRKYLEQHGKFQGYQHGTELLQAVLAPGKWGFRRRGDVEDDPSFKQLIPYCLILQDGKVLVYERGKSGGEKKLHAKLSLGIGGHINPVDGSEHLVGSDALLLKGTEVLNKALRRELEEELSFPPNPVISYAGLINDDGDPVGQVHFGVVAIVEVGSGPIEAREDAIHGLKMVPVKKLKALMPRLEGWSKIVVKNLDTILPLRDFDLIDGVTLCRAQVKAYGTKEAGKKLLEKLSKDGTLSATGKGALPPNAMSIQRILWAIELAERIQPGNCAHIASNIRSTLVHAMRQMSIKNLPKRLQSP